MKFNYIFRIKQVLLTQNSYLLLEKFSFLGYSENELSLTPTNYKSKLQLIANYIQKQKIRAAKVV